MTIDLIQSAVSRSPRRYGVGFCLLLVVFFGLAGCGNQRSYSNENDKLRAERLVLNEQIEALQKQLVLRESELRAVREQLDDGRGAVEGAEPPRLAGIVLGMYSGPIDLDGDLKYDALRVYVRPVDQHSRQMTAKGSVRVRLIATPPEGEPVILLDKRYTADAFHHAYRAGVTGTHYTLKADLPDNPPAKAQLHVTLTDAATGRAYMAQKELVLVREADAAK